MRRVCGDAPDEPQYQLALARILAAGNPIEHAEADAMWTALSTDDHITSTLRVQAYERRAQLAALRSDFATARELLAEARKLPLDGTPRRQLDAEAFALDHQGPAGGALVEYFFGRTLDPARWAALAALAEPDLAFARYLLALQKANAGDWTTATREMDRALAGELPGLAFVRNGARLLALAAYRAHDPAHVEEAIAILDRAEMPTVDHVLAADWRARLAFDATGKLATSR
jgi:tetratricopeptide (TPR) repeat protein